VLSQSNFAVEVNPLAWANPAEANGRLDVLAGFMRAVELDVDFCELCERVISEGSKHLDSKHGAGRYGAEMFRQELAAKARGEQT
jgi:hypothetical protein